MTRLRIGTLGAARIAPLAIVRPARRMPDVDVVAVAARDPERARAWAARHGIPRVLASYDELVADPEIDAVYNPLPNGLHASWTIAALQAGKHVLCEKPFAANASEAAAVAAVAAESGRVVMEAFHYRYHPLARRMAEVVRDGTLGRLRHVEAFMHAPVPKRTDIRWQLDLAGGAAMDMGCYPVSLVRLLAGAEPEVVRAEARLRSPGVDRSMAADLRFPDGVTGRVSCNMLTPRLRVAARAVGEDGELRVLNPFAPQYLHRFSVRRGGEVTRERFERTPTYVFQLRAFAAAVLDGAPVETDPADAVANMTVIDAMYRAAGMEPRGVAR